MCSCSCSKYPAATSRAPATRSGPPSHAHWRLHSARPPPAVIPQYSVHLVVTLLPFSSCNLNWSLVLVRLVFKARLSEKEVRNSARPKDFGFWVFFWKFSLPLSIFSIFRIPQRATIHSRWAGRAEATQRHVASSRRQRAGSCPAGAQRSQLHPTTRGHRSSQSPQRNAASRWVDFIDYCNSVKLPYASVPRRHPQLYRYLAALSTNWLRVEVVPSKTSLPLLRIVVEIWIFLCFRSTSSSASRLCGTYTSTRTEEEEAIHRETALIRWRPSVLLIHIHL